MEKQHTNALAHLPRRVSDAPYWLIIKEGFTHADVFTIDRRGGEAVLPVFSSKEEAEIFSGKDFMEGCWHAQPTGIEISQHHANSLYQVRTLARAWRLSMNSPSGRLSGPRDRKSGVTAPTYTHHTINRTGKARRR